MKNLEAISKKYCGIQHNSDNYSIGGGLDGGKFASRRHEDARHDEGKLTLGQATQMFKKATGLDVAEVKQVINYAVPNMEWHHAGKLPKQYGGGMKKTYFLNAAEICDLATNWNAYTEKLAISKQDEKVKFEQKQNLETRKLEFLQANATKVVRVSTKPKNFHQTAQEMSGKYGWFDSSYKTYNLPEYYTGWVFESSEKHQEFLNIT